MINEYLVTFLAGSFAGICACGACFIGLDALRAYRRRRPRREFDVNSVLLQEKQTYWPPDYKGNASIYPENKTP